MKMVAALYVEPNGPYADLSGVDLWPESRDARLYAGPHPVVAHPPCAAWSMLANVCQARWGTPIREDGGKYAAALASVRNHGGVLEHPAFSMAWRWFGLVPPSTGGGWTAADWLGGWTCHVEQGNYGHACRKGTWLYAVGCELPSLMWGPSRKATLGGPDRKVKRLSSSDPRRRITPAPFRNVLLKMAGSVDRAILS